MDRSRDGSVTAPEGAMQIDPLAVIEQLSMQRNRLADSEAKLMAAVAMLRAENAALKQAQGDGKPALAVVPSFADERLS